MWLFFFKNTTILGYVHFRQLAKVSTKLLKFRLILIKNSDFDVFRIFWLLMVRPSGSSGDGSRAENKFKFAKMEC